MDRAYVVQFMSGHSEGLSLCILAAYSLAMLLLIWLDRRNGLR